MGRERKIGREMKKKTRGGWREGRKNACEINFKKTRGGIPESGVPSDWRNLTSAVNTTALLTQRRNAIWRSKVIVLRVTHALNLYYSKP